MQLLRGEKVLSIFPQLPVTLSTNTFHDPIFFLDFPVFFFVFGKKLTSKQVPWRCDFYDSIAAKRQEGFLCLFRVVAYTFYLECFSSLSQKYPRTI